MKKKKKSKSTAVQFSAKALAKAQQQRQRPTVLIHEPATRPAQQERPTVLIHEPATRPAQREQVDLSRLVSDDPPASQAAMSDQQLAELAERIIQVGSKMPDELSPEDARRLIKEADRPQVLLAAARKLVQAVTLIERTHKQMLARGLPFEFVGKH